MWRKFTIRIVSFHRWYTRNTACGDHSVVNDSQIPRTETLQVELSDKVERQHSVPDENISIANPLGLEESRFPVMSTEEITEINESAASKNTKRTTQTWLTVWMKWCEARNIDDRIERYSPQALDEVLTKFYVEVRKKDGSEYEPDSLRVMQASIDRYLRQKKYPDSITEETACNNWLGLGLNRRLLHFKTDLSSFLRFLRDGELLTDSLNLNTILLCLDFTFG